jgi:hypothetical protein
LILQKIPAETNVGRHFSVSGIFSGVDQKARFGQKNFLPLPAHYLLLHV